ncbi:VOC family protein [Brachybacterium sp. UMB0905]|uniref:VOC family protein n=1 Tax=Brachybacterium sp. UMB0905 TaxID=2069310 RepID=UPI000C80F51B|nr:VOC family protein [Brachybacterium sp. UMB0905]PMC76034.1 hypothetical protein CJ197_05080 [Brachybacterium sp. UMB0905]
MPAALHPYLDFDGNTREAFEFYGEALEVTELIRLHASDVVEGMGGYTRGTNVTLSLMGDDEAVLRSAYEKLSVGEEITMPLEKQMWGDVYGAFTDRFGIVWQVNISGSEG